MDKALLLAGLRGSTDILVVGDGACTFPYGIEVDVLAHRDDLSAGVVEHLPFSIKSPSDDGGIGLVVCPFRTGIHVVNMRLNGILLLLLLVVRIQVTVQPDGVAFEPLRIKTKPKRVVLREPFHGGLVQLFRLTGFDGQSHAVGIGIPVLEYIPFPLPRAFGCLKHGALDA